MKKVLMYPFDNGINKGDCAGWNVDEIVLKSEIHKFSIINEPDCLMLFIPTIIENGIAIEYDGVTVALRIYMEAVRENRLQLRIVLLGVEGKESFLLNYRYPNVLKCPGFDYIRLNKEKIKEYSFKLTLIDSEDARISIERLGITLPKSYVSNHSFINEWCCFVWSRYMDFNEEMEEIKYHLNPNLYFDFLRTLLPNKKNGKITDVKIEEINKLKGKILLIDDNKLWHVFFKNFFKNSKVQFESIGTDFKFKDIKEIIDICEKKYIQFQPDVILLDFRLSEDRDYDVKARTDISGIRVLRRLKGTVDNPGVGFGSKIIMFTATGKIDYVFALQKFGADGFIFKERPEHYPGKVSTKETLNKIIQILGEMARCSILSQKICSFLNLWERNAIIIGKSDKKYEEFPTQIKQLVETIRTLLTGDFFEKSKLKLIYLECFNALEILKRHMESPNTEKMNSFIQWCFPNKILSKWNNIDHIRNTLAHGDEKTEIDGDWINITEEEISKNLPALCEFVTNTISYLCDKK